jgi:hypothetical protein
MNEYWDYFSSGKNWDKSKNGLINFVYDCIIILIKMEVNDPIINSNLKEIYNYF